ncbi:MAG: Hsp70 family protein [Epulopiscium sp.]|nr:Hsp70 family protein [Candidatus Epulonipiscium sp.]
MSWKRYRKMFTSLDKPLEDESKFILGIDIGNQTSVISYWNVNRHQPEWIDVSGGYGKPSIPTVLQYIPENKEWVYGEYALLNKGFFEDITIHDPIKRLGYGEWIDIAGKPMNFPVLLSRYLQELVDICKNINPNAEIIGMVVATPTYFSELAMEEFYRAFSLAGLDQKLITMLPDRECILHSLYHQRQLEKQETILYLDYGNEAIRSGIFQIQTEKEKIQGEVYSSLFDLSLGLQKFDQKLRQLFIQIYCEHTGELSDQLQSEVLHQIDNLLYQNKAMLLQHYYQGKSMKIYFNFVHPAFQKNIQSQELEFIIAPMKEKLEQFIEDTLSKTIDKTLTEKDITKIVLSGGGFEMDWVCHRIKEKFPYISIIHSPFSEGQISAGACWAAASYLGLIDPLQIQLEDVHRVPFDIGLKVKTKRGDQFISFIEKKSFWWQKQPVCSLITQHSKTEELKLFILKRNEKGEESELGEVSLKGLPVRPKGATKLEVCCQMKNPFQIQGIIKDCGFGDFFPATDYVKEFEIQL